MQQNYSVCSGSGGALQRGARPPYVARVSCCHAVTHRRDRRHVIAFPFPRAFLQPSLRRRHSISNLLCVAEHCFGTACEHVVYVVDATSRSMSAGFSPPPPAPVGHPNCECPSDGEHPHPPSMALPNVETLTPTFASLPKFRRFAVMMPPAPPSTPNPTPPIMSLYFCAHNIPAHQRPNRS